MDFLDDVLVKAKDMFDIAKNKTEEAVAIGKQKYDIASMESRLNKSYNALGRLCYEVYSNDESVSDEIKALIKEIASEIEAIEDAKAQIIKIKSNRFCAKCGAPVNESAVFCGQCGEKLVFVEEE